MVGCRHGVRQTGARGDKALASARANVRLVRVVKEANAPCAVPLIAEALRKMRAEGPHRGAVDNARV